jgi:Na+/H+-dicarboxylate symporter
MNATEFVLPSLSPIGLCSLVCASILELDDPQAVFHKLSFYMLTVLVGLAIEALVVLPLIYVVLTRKNVFKFGANMMEALVVAFATSSR